MGCDLGHLGLVPRLHPEVSQGKDQREFARKPNWPGD